MNTQRKRVWSTLAAICLSLTALPALPFASVSAATLLSAEFETTNDSFSARAGETVAWTSDEAHTGECSLRVSGRTNAWHGATRNVSTLMVAGSQYAVSAAVLQRSAEPVEMKLSMQYADASGTTKYDDVALATATSGEWTTLSNNAYTVPAGASDCYLYVETVESLTDFYLDTVVLTGAPATIKKGDADGNLSVNIADAVYLFRFLTGELRTVEAGADYNQDGVVTAVDLSLLKYALLNPSQSQVIGDWDSYQETATPAMQKVYRDGLYSVGNTTRIREKIAKAQSGESVTLAYLGGSITGGGSSSSPSKCFASLSYQYFASTFGTGNNVHYVNAGVAGTSSVVGNIRVDQDVFAKNADVIFIEFAVNDQGGDRFQKSFESLVKKCLMQENAPAVVIVTLCSQSYGSCQDWMAKVAQNYDVPVISGKNAIQNAITAGTLSWSNYGSGDTLHPGDGGHQLIADCIGFYFRQALRSENTSEEPTMPNKAVYGDEYATAKLVTYADLQNLNTGSFTKGTNQQAYPNGFTNSKNGNNPLTFTVNGKGFLLLFQSNSNSSMGTVNVTVNGVTRKVSSNLQYTWGGLDGDLGYYQPNSGKLDVSISMENPSSTFVMYGIAVIS